MKPRLILPLAATLAVVAIAIATPWTDTQTSSGHIEGGPTFVSGPIAINTTWALADSPFIVTGSIGVAPNITLTIEPGVEVRLASGTEIYVLGTLDARGTAGSRIRFTRENTANWGRIFISWTEPSSRGYFEYVVIEGTDSSGVNGHHIDIRSSILRDNQLFAIASSGDSTIVGNLIMSNYSGIRADNTNEIRDNVILSNSHAGIEASGNLSATGNIVGHNRGSGLFLLGSATVNDNVICHNGENGVYVNTASVSLQRNLIAHNSLSGVHSYGNTSAANNNIIDNGQFAWEHVGNQGIDATLNWWGTTDEGAISASIYDFFDTIGSGIVTFKPFLTAPSGGVPTSCDGLLDADGDGVLTTDEWPCGGGDGSNAAVRPERLDGAFAWVDDDGDTVVDEALPAGSEPFDCDGDGFTGRNEAGSPLCVGSANEDGFEDAVANDGCPGGPPQAGAYSEAEFKITTSDQDPCGGTGWPFDLFPGGFQPNTINIQDLASFVTPARRLNTSPDDAGFNVRWDLVPGSTFGKQINIADVASLLTGPTAFPPMLSGEKAYGKACPWPP